MSTPGKVEAPERIWLQDGCDEPGCAAPCVEVRNYRSDDVTWCQDQIHGNDTAYVRADLYDEAIAALKAVKAQVDDAYGMLPWMADWACAECRPDSDMISEGFRCGRHQAAAVIQKARPTGARTPEGTENG